MIKCFFRMKIFLSRKEHSFCCLVKPVQWSWSHRPLANGKKSQVTFDKMDVTLYEHKVYLPFDTETIIIPPAFTWYHAVLDLTPLRLRTGGFMPGVGLGFKI